MRAGIFWMLAYKATADKQTLIMFARTKGSHISYSDFWRRPKVGAQRVHVVIASGAIAPILFKGFYLFIFYPLLTPPPY